MDRKIEVSQEGHLLLGGCDAVKLAKQYGTPLYVMDETAVREAMRAYRQSIEEFYGGGGGVYFAPYELVFEEE